MSQLTMPNITGSIIRPNYANGGVPVSQVVRDTPFLSFLELKGRVQQTGGSVPILVSIRTATNTAALYNEGDAAPTVYSDTYALGRADVFAVWNSAGQSGRVIATNRAGGILFDAVKDSIASAILNVRKKIEVELLGSTTDRGISSLVDDGDTLYGLAPGTYTSWKSDETNVAGPLTVDVMEDLFSRMRNSTNGESSLDFVLVSPTQLNNYGRLGSLGGSSDAYRIQMDSFKQFDLGIIGAGRGLAFNGVPFIEVQDMSTAELIVGNSAHYTLMVHEDMNVLVQPNTNTDQSILVNWSGVPVIDRRKSFGKLRGLDA